MTRTSPFLEEKMAKANCYCAMQVVFVDIVAYSKRRSYAQLNVINAFMRSLEAALSQTARAYVDYTQTLDVQIRRDVVVLPSGDGAAVAFPFDGAPEMHLFFACELLKSVDNLNRSNVCDSFQQHGWCNCHAGFLLRCGVSEGKLILYKDLNGNYNLAGDPINLASRVMALAHPGQIFLTAGAYDQIADLIPCAAERFRQYAGVGVKHDRRIDIYQYVDTNVPGLNVAPRGDLLPAPEPTLTLSAQDTNTAHAINQSGRLELLPGKRDATRGDKRVLARLRERMVVIASGEFRMGSGRTAAATVEIRRSFLMDRYVVTQEDYQEVMGSTPSHFVGARRPVENISWIDAIAFCNGLSDLAGLEPAYVIGADVAVNFKATGYRLPTEAEWEYCCRAGSTEDRYGTIDEIAWYAGNADGQTREVGMKKANAFGLYDMLGNVWEWCNDWYERELPQGKHVDYCGPASGFERVLRGGSWRDLPDCVTASYRLRNSAMTQAITHGMRLVLPIT